MRIVSWNVNSIRARHDRVHAWLTRHWPDVVLLQETKVNAAEMDWSWLPGWHLEWNPAEKPGYSGTAILSKHRPMAVSRGIGRPEHDREGRVVTAEYASCFVVSVYTPNAQAELARLPYRMEWDAAFLAYLKELEKRKPVFKGK